MPLALAGKPATVLVEWTDGDGVTIDPTAPVTVTAVRSDGTAITGLTATANGNPGQYTTTLTAVQTSTLDNITFTWTDATGAVQASYLDIVGAHLFTVNEARLSDRALMDVNKYTDEDLIRGREEVTRELELICRQSFIPRLRSLTLNGDSTDTLVLPDVRIRKIRSVSISGVALTAPQLATVYFEKYGFMSYAGSFVYGDQNIVVRYEYGWDAPPADLKRAALLRLRHRLNMAQSGVPDRALSFSSVDGGTYSLATAGRAGFETGIPDVDAVYSRYRDDTPAIA